MDKLLVREYPLQGAEHVELLPTADAALFQEGCGFNVGSWSFCNLAFDGRFVGVCQRARGETDEVWECRYDTVKATYVLSKRGYYDDDTEKSMASGTLAECMELGHKDMEVNSLRKGPRSTMSTTKARTS